MNIYCINHNYLYETEKLLFLFMPFEKNTCLKDFAEDNGDYFYTEINKTEDKIYFKAELSLKGEKQSSEREKTIADCTDEEYDLLSLAYPLLKNMCGYAPKWGMLTGVRPSKLLLNKMEEKGEEYAVDYFLNRFFVDEKKTALALSVAKAEREIIKNSPENSFSLYISIPFCPTRCSYCSFPIMLISYVKR